MNKLAVIFLQILLLFSNGNWLLASNHFYLSPISQVPNIKQERYDILMKLMFDPKASQRKDLADQLMNTFQGGPMSNPLMVFKMIHFTRFVLFPRNLKWTNTIKFKIIFDALLYFFDFFEKTKYSLSDQQAKTAMMLILHPRLTKAFKDQILMEALEKPWVLDLIQPLIHLSIEDSYEEMFTIEYHKFNDMYQRFEGDPTLKKIYLDVTIDNPVYPMNYPLVVLKDQWLEIETQFSIPENLADHINRRFQTLIDSARFFSKRNSSITVQAIIQQLIEKRMLRSDTRNKKELQQKLVAYMKQRLQIDDMLLGKPWNQIDPRMQGQLIEAYTESLVFDDVLDQKTSLLRSSVLKSELYQQLEISESTPIQFISNDFIEIPQFYQDSFSSYVQIFNDSIDNLYSSNISLRPKSNFNISVQGIPLMEESTDPSIIFVSRYNIFLRDMEQSNENLNLDELLKALKIENKYTVPREFDYQQLIRVVGIKTADHKWKMFEKLDPEERELFVAILYSGIHIKTITPNKRVNLFSLRIKNEYVHFLLNEDDDSFHLVLAFRETFPVWGIYKRELGNQNLSFSQIETFVKHLFEEVEKSQLPDFIKELVKVKTFQGIQIAIPDTFGYSYEELEQYQDYLKSARDGRRNQKGSNIIPDISLLVYPLFDYYLESNSVAVPINFNRQFNHSA